MLTAYPIDVIESYIDKCEEKVNYHSNNSKNSRVWDNVLSLLNLFLSASCGLSMTILTVVEADPIAATVVGAGYAFLITISTKVKDNFNFNLLNYQHSQLQDDFSELKIIFEKLKYTSEHADLEKSIIKYEHILKTSHIQSVKACYFWCLCNG